MNGRTALSPAKQALREARLAGQHRAAPIMRRAPGQDPPLTYGQEQLWFIDQLQPGVTAYNLPVVLRLSGGVDEAVMERAIAEMVRRHETLRTTFRQAEGVPVQAVAPFAGFPLAVEDLSALPGDEREREVALRAAREGAHVFDLAAGPLFRASLLRLAADEHVLLMCIHHAVADGWSVKVMLHEVSVLYDAFRQGRPSPLPELPIQYGDFAAWQREQVEGAGARHLAYWKGQLAGAPDLLELPTDRPRPPVPSFRGARVPVQAGAEVLEGLRALARDEGATLHMVVLAAFQVLLGRHAATDDVLVGSPVAGRTRKETEGLIGLFVNTLVLRTDLSGDPSFRELVGRVREVALAAYQHQDAPFERIVAEVQPRRSLSHSALYQVVFRLDEIGGAGTVDAGAGVGGLRAKAVTAEQASTPFDLTFSANVLPDRLAGSLEYGTDLFDEATARRMALHLERVLEQAAAEPDARLSALDLMDAAERRRVLEAYNATAAEYPAGACIHDLVQAQAARTPGAVAVVAGGETLTYAELDARANRLAHHLAALGAGPEQRVGICLERSAGMVVAMHAVLRAGAAYLPLDPAYPAERLAYMLADSGARLLVTQEALRGLLPAGGVRTVSLDGDADGIAARPADAPRTAVVPANAAYVIYTSGSTGTPKGVVVTHANVGGFFTGMDGRVGGPVPGTWLAVTRISFDIHVLELLWTLSRGFRVVVQPEADRVPEGESVAAQLRRHGVTHLQCTPSLATMLIAEGGVGTLAGLDRLLLGGEALPAELAAQVRAVLPDGLVNLYGPTETTVWSATHAVDAEGPVPIGRPIANTRVYVLNAGLRPQPAGVPGELFIGGAGVARGYPGRPGLTAERFVPDPFGAAAGARLYRTGDRARWRADGALEYLGRLDEQLKVRGHRIEPGEIEAVLRRHPAVRDCVVVAREDAPGDTRLAAYLVGGADAGELRELLRGALPEYMVPGAFVALDALPLTPNGKLDRRALPAPEHGLAQDSFMAPRTPVEATLAGIWAEVLRLERVGVRDNFFELGGHSLLATRMVSRVRATFGIELPLRAVFEAPTVGELAERHFRGQGGAADEPETIEELSPNRLLAVLDELSEEELDLLLSEEPKNRIFE